jgi:hypothetical protein
MTISFLTPSGLDGKTMSSELEGVRKEMVIPNPFRVGWQDDEF